MNEVTPDIHGAESREKTAGTLIYRGIREPHSRDRIGQWWTTNPFYALAFASGGQLFVARIGKDELERAHDVSQDEYPNYGFPDYDPLEARAATAEEIGQLRSIGDAESEHVVSDRPGGALMKTPLDPAAVGEQVFAQSFEA